MTTMISIESLPNELWLLFMIYLTSIDVFRSLLGLNHRINCLLFSMPSRLVLDTSQCGESGVPFSDIRQLIKGKDYWSKCLLSSIDTIRLSDTLTSYALCNHFKSTMSIFSILFSSLRRLYMTEGAIDRINISKLLFSLPKSLSYVHFTFGWFSPYFKILHTFIDHQVSFYSMVFDVKNGKFSQSFYPLTKTHAFHSRN
jgi:hypothetical protein